MIGVRNNRVWLSVVGAVVALTTLVLTFATPALSITRAEVPLESTPTGGLRPA